MDVTILAIAFILTLLAELGDKTQLTVIFLSSIYDKREVFFGSLTGLLLISLLTIIAGSFISTLMSKQIINLFCGLVFIAFGMSLLRKGEFKRSKLRFKSPFLTSFAVISICEIGDKTQFSTLALAAKYGLLGTFIGISLAFVVITWLGVIIGKMMLERISIDKLKIFASLVFVAFGLLTLAGI